MIRLRIKTRFAMVVLALLMTLTLGAGLAWIVRRSIVADSGGGLVFDKSRPTTPFIFVYMYPKYPLPGEDVVGGLKVAVWQDGKVVRVRSASEVGKAYIQGWLKPEQLAELIRSIERTGILATQSDESSPLHAASDVLKIRTRNGQLAWSNFAARESAQVKQIDEMLRTIDIPDAGLSDWEDHFPHEWDK